ncbi:MAG: hypothetical protein L3J59_10970 [Methylococcaceae bacterium]|nr:hypothetical protein [Methylococcaceae bacterium]
MIALLKKQSGTSLIELVFSIIIISISLTGILSVMTQTISHSADPIVQFKAITIAESYLEKTLSKTYSNITLGNFSYTVDGYIISLSVLADTVAGQVVKKAIVNVSGLGVSLDLVGYAANEAGSNVIYKAEKYE